MRAAKAGPGKRGEILIATWVVVDRRMQLKTKQLKDPSAPKCIFRLEQGYGQTSQIF
jgi:hypothetical protein